MDMNAINERIPEQRPDGRWGISNDYTGESKFAGPGFATWEDAEQAIARNETEKEMSQ